MAIDRGDFAKESVREALNCGASAHYMLAVAQLRSGIADGAVNDEIGPFRLKQADWDAHCKDVQFELDFLPTDISDPDMQIPVFAVMIRRAFDTFATAKSRNPSAQELYLQQFPGAPQATLTADLKTALDATAGLVDPAATALLGDPTTLPKVAGADQPVSGDGGPVAGGGGPGVFNAKRNAFFCSLVPGGFFSSDPDDMRVLRSVRTNNPGALNISDWQRHRIGFVGVTKDDGKGNVTSIYAAPEYGVAAWYFLLSDRYGFGHAGSFTIADLARHYAGGGAAASVVNNYVNAWSRLADTHLSAASVVRLGNDAEMLNLARGMFKNEASANLRITNNQILFAIQHERNNTLPAPPHQ